jgi:hypothetical protein
LAWLSGRNGLFWGRDRTNIFEEVSILAAEIDSSSKGERDMRYMLLIYTPEKDFKALSEGEKGKLYQEYMAFTDSIQKSGHYKAGDPLDATPTAKTVRKRNGKAVKTDGPFAETREQLGGYYIVEAKSIDEAADIAGRIPGARNGSIEVRPIVDM